MKTYIAVQVILLMTTFCVFGQEKYSEVNINLESKQDVEILSDLGIAVDHFIYQNNSIRLVVNQNEMEILASNGFEFKVVEKDIAAAFVKANRNHLKGSGSFCDLLPNLDGSMGGYHTYNQVVEILQNLASSYPDIVELTLLGKSYEERDIYAVKISDNVSIDESDVEGTAYYDALTHAREPLSMESTLYYMLWLVENYDSDRLVTYIVNNRELYFVPIVNPDGYVYNQTIAPDGGGGWRKNRRPIDDECIGVDLNRNYSHQWEGPGSASDNPCSALYKGVSPTSEPETKLIQELIDRIEPKSGFSSHSFSQVMIDPDKSGDDYDFETYSKHASEFTPSSYRGYGSAGYLIGYLASGTTLDYLNLKGALAWTPEIGTRFWEPANDICEYVAEMQLPMRHISMIAGAYPSFASIQYLNDGALSVGDVLEINVALTNKGTLHAEEEVSVNIVPLSLGLDAVKASHGYGTLDVGQFRQNIDAPFLFELTSEVDYTKPISIAIETYLGEVQVDVDIVEYYPGLKRTIFEDDFESDLSSWSNMHPDHPWRTTDIDSWNGTYSLVESAAQYSAELNTEIVLKEKLDFIEAINPVVTFYMKHSLESQKDYVQLMASTDGVTWNSLAGQTTKLFGQDEHIIDGTSYWIEERMDLSHYAGESEVQLKFVFTTNESNEADGIYIDDFKVIDYTEELFSPTDDLDPLQSIKISPNPSTDYLNIQIVGIHSSASKSFKLTNSMGALLMAKTFSDITPSELSIDISHLPQGIYYVSIELEKRVLTQKIIKQ